MFKVPLDIIVELKREFPNVPNMEKIIDRLFYKIFKKTISIGSCSIMRLGTFFAYKVFSNRVKKLVPRFKFSVSRTLKAKLDQDSYIVEQIPETREITKRLELIVESSKGKKNNYKKKTKSVQDEISSILDVDFEGDDNGSGNEKK